MSVTSALANQGFSKDSVTSGVTSGVMSGNPYLDGYQFRWVAGSRYAKSYTPLWSNTPSFGGGTTVLYAYSNEVPEGYESLEGFACRVTLLARPSRVFYTKKLQRP